MYKDVSFSINSESFQEKLPVKRSSQGSLEPSPRKRRCSWVLAETTADENITQTKVDVDVLQLGSVDIPSCKLRINEPSTLETGHEDADLLKITHSLGRARWRKGFSSELEEARVRC